MKPIFYKKNFRDRLLSVKVIAERISIIVGFFRKAIGYFFAGINNIARWRSPRVANQYQLIPPANLRIIGVEIYMLAPHFH